MNQLFHKSGKYLRLSVFLIAFLLPSCDDVNENPFPDVQVYFTVNLIVDNDVSVPGNSIFFPGVGYGGIITYCFQYDQYYAFDATCTYEISPSCVVVKAENPQLCPCLLDNFILTCPCCGSEFSAIDGSILKGPASLPLKQYNVAVFNNYTTLRIQN